jgi:hypothetical protein
MNYSKGNAGLFAVVVVGLALAGAFIFGWSGNSGTPVQPVAVENVDPSTQPAGALVGPEATNPYQCFNGSCTFYNRIPFKTATTTVCAIKSPNATSSLDVGSGLHFQTSSTSATTVTIARATTPYATTTLISSHSIAANARASIVATSTPAIFPPNTYFVVGMAGGVGTFSPSGACHADFDVI